MPPLPSRRRGERDRSRPCRCDRRARPSKAPPRPGRLTEWRIDLGDIAALPGDVVRQVVQWASFQGDTRDRSGAGATRPRAPLLGRNMDDVHPRSGNARDIRGMLDRIGLDKRRTAAIPDRQPALALRILGHQSVAQRPRHFDRFRMRADLPAARRSGFAKTKEKSIIDIRQAEPLALAAPDVQENLERGNAEVAHILRHVGELFLGRDHEMIGEVDARACMAHVEDRRKNLVERLRRHHVGHERRDAAARGCGSFLVRVESNARLRDVTTVTEVEVRIDRAGKYHQAAGRDLFFRRARNAGSEDRREASVGDSDVTCGKPMRR